MNVHFRAIVRPDHHNISFSMPWTSMVIDVHVEFVYVPQCGSIERYMHDPGHVQAQLTFFYHC